MALKYTLEKKFIEPVGATRGMELVVYSLHDYGTQENYRCTGCEHRSSGNPPPMNKLPEPMRRRGK